MLLLSGPCLESHLLDGPPSPAVLKHFSAPYIIFHFSSLVSKSSKPGCIYLWSWSWSFDTKGKGSQRTVSAVILAELEWSTTDLSYLTLSTCPAKLHVFCGDEKGSVWIYHLSNYTTAWSSAKGKHSDKRIPPTQILKWPELRANGDHLSEVYINNVITDPTFTYLVALTSVNITAIWKKS